MDKLFKTDFHLHTRYSDNRDRMEPAEYATLARRFGYSAIGFCDHHHNLTQTDWQALRQAAVDLTASDLLVTTGYEATFVTGHLCVLNKTQFDGEYALQCARQIFSPDNTRIVAHPDNNSCAWRLPLPVGADGVEIINGGQDLYAYRPTSPCNGLRTFQTYLLLNHPLAAVAQSDCHERALFGRVWTGMWMPETAATAWPAVHRAIADRRTFAAMGDISVRFWQDVGDASLPMLGWEVPDGAELFIYCGDRPVAYVDPIDARKARFGPMANGYYWILAKRGLAWAVTSPIYIQGVPGDGRASTARRTALLANALVRQKRATLERRIEQLMATQSTWNGVAYPVAQYLAWFHALLPEHWPLEEFVDGNDELLRRAVLRLDHAQALADAVYAGVLCQTHHISDSGEHTVRVVLAPDPGKTGNGAIQFMIDTPHAWNNIRLTDQSGDDLVFVAMPVGGERDPLNSQRSREQMRELITWLHHGEMHEYAVRNVAVERGESQLSVVFDLYPAALDRRHITYKAQAAELEALLQDQSIREFFVHTRMPRRFGVLLEADLNHLQSIHATASLSGDPDGRAARRMTLLSEASLQADILADGLVVQVT